MSDKEIGPDTTVRIVRQPDGSLVGSARTALDALVVHPASDTCFQSGVTYCGLSPPLGLRTYAGFYRLATVDKGKPAERQGRKVSGLKGLRASR